MTWRCVSIQLVSLQSREVQRYQPNQCYSSVSIQLVSLQSREYEGRVNAVDDRMAAFPFN